MPPLNLGGVQKVTMASMEANAAALRLICINVHLSAVTSETAINPFLLVMQEWFTHSVICLTKCTF